ncbi:MAG TPA: L-arabinose isomerase [Solirubrobacteraceae bacterium]|jgi:L-arabinose isomerase|nr:L-arabinose isomerase [Solirubrobacteraceae bacterium]
MQVGTDELECWFLTGSQHLYGEETLRQVAAQSAEIVRQLDGAPEIPVKIVPKPVLTGSDEIRDVCLAANRAANCIGVIAWMHTFSPAKAWIAGLEALQQPLLHLHTQANRSLPWGTIDMDFMNLNQSAHGDREFGYICTRLGIRRKVVAGHVSDPATRTRIASWLSAAAGWRSSRGLRIARFGDNMRDVAVTDGDRVEAQRTFGWSIQGHSINDLTEAVRAAPADTVDAIVAEYEQAYDVVPALRAGGERHESLRVAAQIEAGLRSFLKEGHFSAFTTNFQDLGALEQLPGIAPQRLMADGYGFGAEGDWKTSALLRVMKVMGAGRPGGTSFMEDYTYHFGPGDPLILGSHMLEICPTISSGRASCEIHPLGIGNREDPVRLVFDADPGPGFVVGILDLGDRFRLVANTIEIVPPVEPLPNLPVARAAWKPTPSLSTSAECWITAGGPHHTILTTQIEREALEDLAAIAGVELAWIDDASTTAEFARELDWNTAYHRLAPR